MALAATPTNRRAHRAEEELKLLEQSLKSLNSSVTQVQQKAKNSHGGSSLCQFCRACFVFCACSFSCFYSEEIRWFTAGGWTGGTLAWRAWFFMAVTVDFYYKMFKKHHIAVFTFLLSKTVNILLKWDFLERLWTKDILPVANGFLNNFNLRK